MPLADVRSVVAGRLQIPREATQVGRVIGEVIRHAMGMGVQSRKVRRPGRRAKRRRYEHVFEPCALGGDPVEIRRLQERVPLAAKLIPSLVVGQDELKLNGVAVLKWAMLFDVYAGALYLPAGVGGQAWSDDVAKRLELSYFREIEAKGFAEASDKILQDNLLPAECQNLAKRLQDFYGLFRDVKPGDRYSINYLPEQGTELRLNEQPLGRVAGADFAAAYFGLWLGAEPISKGFRDRLLDSD